MSFIEIVYGMEPLEGLPGRGGAKGHNLIFPLNQLHEIADTPLRTFFEFPQEIRTLIYTTNAVEALHRQFRKVTKAKTQFPSDEALTKMLYLAYKGISKKWTMPVRNWAMVISQFVIFFPERLKAYV